jgi:hypothetical protein
MTGSSVPDTAPVPRSFPAKGIVEPTTRCTLQCPMRLK